MKLKRNDVELCGQLRTHAETFKRKIEALGNILRRYHKGIKRYHQNNLFVNNQREFFGNIEKTTSETMAGPPSPLEM